jgi:hypothetical protein
MNGEAAAGLGGSGLFIGCLVLFVILMLFKTPKSPELDKHVPGGHTGTTGIALLFVAAGLFVCLFAFAFAATGGDMNRTENYMKLMGQAVTDPNYVAPNPWFKVERQGPWK